MNDPSLGNWALSVLASIIAGAITGLGVYGTLFRAQNARVEARLNDRMALVERRQNTLEDKLSDAVHDLQKADNVHDVQLNILTTTLTHLNESIGRVEQMIVTASMTKESQFEKLLAAIKKE